MGASAQRGTFGRLDDGEVIERARLAGEGIEASVISYGAAVQEIKVALGGGLRRVTLGLEDLESYVRHSPHMGAVAGRFANRIGHGRFTLDGRTYQLACNENGRTHLHGGARGFGKRAWTMEDAGDAHVRLALVSPDGDEGYPGRLVTSCTYRIAGPRHLVVDITATCDAPTIVNLATHSYFNLAGSGDARDHRLTLACDRYLPVDDDLIPTGEISPVAGTPFDFRTMRRIRSYPPVRYDNAFVAATSVVTAPRELARLEAPDGSLALEVWSTEPCIQLYDGGKIRLPVAGLGGQHYGPFSGLCLEPQRFPDSPNQPGFTDAVLRPGETYRQTTEYRFSVQGGS